VRFEELFFEKMLLVLKQVVLTFLNV